MSSTSGCFLWARTNRSFVGWAMIWFRFVWGFDYSESNGNSVFGASKCYLMRTQGSISNDFGSHCFAHETLCQRRQHSYVRRSLYSHVKRSLRSGVYGEVKRFMAHRAVLLIIEIYTHRGTPTDDNEMIHFRMWWSKRASRETERWMSRSRIVSNQHKTQRTHRGCWLGVTRASCARPTKKIEWGLRAWLGQRYTWVAISQFIRRRVAPFSR